MPSISSFSDCLGWIAAKLFANLFLWFLDKHTVCTDVAWLWFLEMYDVIFMFDLICRLYTQTSSCTALLMSSMAVRLTSPTLRPTLHNVLFTRHLRTSSRPAKLSLGLSGNSLKVNLLHPKFFAGRGIVTETPACAKSTIPVRNAMPSLWYAYVTRAWIPESSQEKVQYLALAVPHTRFVVFQVCLTVSRRWGVVAYASC